MPTQIRTTEIGKAKFSMMELGPIEAFELEARVLPVLLGGIGPIMGAIKASDEAQSIAFSQAIDSMLKAMPPKELSALMIEIVEKFSLVDEAGSASPISLIRGDLSGPKHMATRYGLVKFFFEVHFRDFIEGQLSEIKALIARLNAEKKAEDQTVSEAV